MSREISGGNAYTEKLVKLIPTEIIGAYLAIEGMVSTLPSIQYIVLIISCLALTILIPFYLWFLFGVRSKLQIAVTMISFVVWIFSIGGPFLQYTWYLQVYGAVALILWTLVVPVLKYDMPDYGGNND